MVDHFGVSTTTNVHAARNQCVYIRTVWSGLDITQQRDQAGPHVASCPKCPPVVGPHPLPPFRSFRWPRAFSVFSLLSRRSSSLCRAFLIEDKHVRAITFREAGTVIVISGGFKVMLIRKDDRSIFEI